MATTSEKYQANIDQPGTFWVVVHKLQSLVTELIGFFTLSEEERKQAGIYHGGGGRD